MKKSYIFILSLFLINLTFGQVKITIDPHTTSSIKGHLELNRQKYFNISSGGNYFEKKVGNSKLLNTYLNDYQMNFGRDLGMIRSQVKWAKSVQEDKNRPGYADLEILKKRIKIDNSGSSSFNSRWKNLDVAMHDAHNAYPDFMPTYSAPKKEEEIFPLNNEAAAELAVSILKYGYNNFNRPSTYEIVNEPHWSVLGEQNFADLHLAVLNKSREEDLKTMIGGPCFSVGYFYKKNYKNLNGFSKFIDNTGAKLDFYSFHIYDFLEWDKEKQDFHGRVTTGLPLEGVLDAVQNYTYNHFEKEVPMVISEHGGYLFKEKNNMINDTLAEQLIGSKKKNFNYEMKKRSVSDRLMTRSAIANTMTFINNPHVIQKAVPFILLQTTSWNPKYYASLLVPNNYVKGSKWVESAHVNFFKFFSEIEGKRVLSHCEDPDIQYQTFLKDKNLFVILNNLSDKSEKINFVLSNTDIDNITVKRHGQNADFTPYFKEEKIKNLNTFILKEKESVVLKIVYKNSIQTKESIDTTPYYGSLGNKVIDAGKVVECQILVPDYNKAKHASLRISVGRQSSNSGKDLKILFNDEVIQIKNEDIAEYLQDNTDYGAIKIMDIKPQLLKEKNTVKISFPDGKIGGVGSVVLRVGIAQ